MHHLRAQLLRKEDINLVEQHKEEHYLDSDAKASANLRNLNEIPSAYEI
jgi:hypothetical protein